MTLLTLSKIKRVCTVALVPRLFRGDGCTPGKFHKLPLDGIQKVYLSSESDDSKNEERRCKKCKRLIEYAFGPPEVVDGERNKTPLPHVNIYARPDSAKDPQHSDPHENEIPADHIPDAKYRKGVTHLDDLKSTSLEQAKVNALLRARDVDMVVAAVDKKENETNLCENKEDKNDLAKRNEEESKTSETTVESGQVLSEVSTRQRNVMLSEGQEASTKSHTNALENGQFTNAGLKSEVSYLVKEVAEHPIESKSNSNSTLHEGKEIPNNLAEVSKTDATFLANAIETLKLENPSLGRSSQATFNSNTAECKKDQSSPASVTINEKLDSFDSKEEKSSFFTGNPTETEKSSELPTATTGDKDFKAAIHVAERNELESSAENATKVTENPSTGLEKEESILHATTSSKENDENLTQKIEEINELSPIGGIETKSDILNPPRSIGPSFKNASIAALEIEQARARMFDDTAKKHFGLSANQYFEKMKQVNVLRNDKVEGIERSVHCQGGDTIEKQRLQKNQPASEVLIKESDFKSEVTASKTLTEHDRGTILNEGYPCESLEPVIDSRFYHLSNIQSGQQLFKENDLEDKRLLPEHRHPYHLYQTALIDQINPAAPTSAVQVKEYPSAFMSMPVKREESFQNQQYSGESWNYQNQSIAHQYTDTWKGNYYVQTEALQPQAEPVVPKPDTMTPRLKVADKSNLEEMEISQPQAGPVLPDKKQDAMNPRLKIEHQSSQDLVHGEQAANKPIDMTQNIIQPQPRLHDTNEGSLAKNPLNIIDELPEINLNDDTVPLTELLRRVRERNRIMYCREMGLQMAKNLAALNPEGKCGDKKPTCPPPPTTCPPPPPPCPPPPPKCPPPACPKPCPPPPCPPPTPKCPPPPPTCPPPKQNPCAKFQTQNTISLALHLGPIINTSTEALPPSIKTDWSDCSNFLLQKLSDIRKVISSIFQMSSIKSLIETLKVFGSRDYNPWTPIPSWPYPIVQRKRKLQCPKDGCPYIPPPSTQRRPPCFEKPCEGFPKRLSFSSML